MKIDALLIAKHAHDMVPAAARLVQAIAHRTLAGDVIDDEISEATRHVVDILLKCVNEETDDGDSKEDSTGSGATDDNSAGDQPG